MSNRIFVRTCRSAFALGLLAAASASFSGCTTMGSRAFGGTDQVVTGSANTVASGNTNQSMPGALAPRGNSSGKYLPPAEVGAAQYQNMQSTAGFNTTPAPGGASTVMRQDLPSLQPTSQPGSTQTMPAQQLTTPTQPAPTQIAVSAPIKTPAPAVQPIPQSGYNHIVESGESLYAIARRYKVTTDSLMFANNLSSPDKIFVGQKIVVPGATANVVAAQPTIAKPSVATPPVKSASAPTPAATPVPVETKPAQASPAPVKVASTAPVSVAPTTTVVPAAADGKFRWPVSGKLITNFAASKGTGINIEVPEGTAVRAAENGSIIYVGSAVEGYGNLILVRHDNGYVSAYAHLSQITVSKGDAVTRGDAIGLAGSTGSVSSPQLHFELRKGATPVDPVPMLAS